MRRNRQNRGARPSAAPPVVSIKIEYIPSHIPSIFSINGV